METEEDALARRIIKDLMDSLRLETVINEFDIIPCPEGQNRSPVVRVGPNVGLESWCVPHVYKYAYNQLMSKKRQHTAKYAELLVLSNVVLLLNPDVLTAWNLRKEWVLSRRLSAPIDLWFSRLAQQRKPNCAVVFAHRRWLLKGLLSPEEENDTMDASTASELIETEMKLCEVTAERHANNYHAWNHRIWMIKEFLDCSDSILRNELSFSEHWMERHVSDHSGMQYRQFILSCTIDCEGSPEALLQSELEMNSRLLATFPDHEALWYHRRFVVFKLHSSFNVAAFNKQCKKSKILLDREQSILADEEKMLENHAQYESSSYLIDRHRRWIRRLVT